MPPLAMLKEGNNTEEYLLASQSYKKLDKDFSEESDKCIKFLLTIAMVIKNSYSDRIGQKRCSSYKVFRYNDLS